MKDVFKLVPYVIIVVFLEACTNGNYHRQPSNGFSYLDSTQLYQWKTLVDQKLEFSSAYHIPSGDVSGSIGRSVDIRPPQQILEFIQGAHYEHNSDGLTVLIPCEEKSECLWQTIKSMVTDNRIPIRTLSIDGIETDWLSWISEDDDEVIESRYSIVPVVDRGRAGFLIDMVEWKSNGQTRDINGNTRDRYTTKMTNMITERYDSNLRKKVRMLAQQLVSDIPIDFGKDYSGFPVILALSPYHVFWEKFPSILAHLGFIVKDRNQSQGTLDVKYEVTDYVAERGIGGKPLQLYRKNYKFILGDLGNRTSINLIDSTGKPVNEEILLNLSQVLAAVVDNMKDN
ncbi:outer membrane protein assembly factor BamC [Candidatus Enterovibrio escicola]|uniref:Outer membrane protein NlpB n=2 Tax=Candidatus Enterovibrio escicola TaxID=1927127 RepID=A0A2A5T164_9GAMM|nr:outer membrane protein assembly factor BamC [Candidatus Enterovibrio escacola]PCS21905.1 Outer membrane protein NlpB [Candidatus Enterovibrio escacola]